MTETAEAVRQVPRIGRECVTKNSDGLAYQVWRVVLPAGVVMQDLQDHPEMWGGVQTDPNVALRLDDHLHIVASDRSWAATVVVIDADRHRVVLSKPIVLWSGQTGRVGTSWEDDHYEIEWTGNGYSIFRKSQGNRPRTLLKGGFNTIDQAKNEVFKRYPKAL